MKYTAVYEKRNLSVLFDKKKFSTLDKQHFIMHIVASHPDKGKMRRSRMEKTTITTAGLRATALDS